jgi:16S rRNA (guanine527-N7)-methyltransferase
MGTSFLSVGLLDSNQKKAAFLQQAVTELELNQSDTEVRVFAERIELHRPVAPYDLILCRAFSSLTEFVQPTRSLLASGGVLAAMKGVLPQDEIDALPKDIRVYATHRLHVPGVDAERHLILLQPDASPQEPSQT